MPLTPNQTGSPIVALEVLIPSNNPLVTTLTIAFVAPVVSNNPKVLELVASLVFDALETSIFVPFAPLIYTACPFVIPSVSLTVILSTAFVLTFGIVAIAVFSDGLNNPAFVLMLN